MNASRAAADRCRDRRRDGTPTMRLVPDPVGPHIAATAIGARLRFHARGAGLGRWGSGSGPVRSGPRRGGDPVRRIGVALLLVVLAPGCVSIGPSADLAAPAPVFVPQAFFAGRTVGDGRLRVVLSRSRPVHVAGDGRIGPGDALTLMQRVEEGGKPPRERTWHLTPAAGGGLVVGLSDARGPVEADVVGNRLHLRFHAGGGLRIEQWIYLRPDGRTALNRMAVRKFGVPVAALHETIRRVP